MKEDTKQNFLNKLISVLGPARVYGKENVQRNVLVNGWDIDFFVSTTLVYFQLDGVYWHGLDRPIVKQTNTTIQKTMLRDKKQIDWFQKNNKKLVRITDKQMLQYIKEQCASKIILDVGQGR